MEGEDLDRAFGDAFTNRKQQKGIPGLSEQMEVKGVQRVDQRMRVREGEGPRIAVGYPTFVIFSAACYLAHESIY